MLASRRRILLIAIAAEIVVTLVPPWTRTELVQIGERTAVVDQSAGFHPIFSPPTTGLGQAIDLGRLVIAWSLVAWITAFAWFWTRPNDRQSERPSPDT